MIIHIACAIVIFPM